MRVWSPPPCSSPTAGLCTTLRVLTSTIRAHNLNGAFRKVSNCRATHEAICADVKKASQRTADLKRKATEAH